MKRQLNGCNYSLQCFQGAHTDEYTLKNGNTVCLFQNGILKMCYEEDDNGDRVGDFTRFENGCVSFVQSFDDILDIRNCNRIVNHVRGERMEIYSCESGKQHYHGEFNEKREREGWGIEYDEKSGAMLLEGIWKGNKLVEIIRKIEGNIMTEFKRNGDNTKSFNRIPVYVGEFVYDEEKESFIRNGRGYWIDEETRIATREVEWKDGVEVSGRDLYDGWYTRSTTPKPKSIPAAFAPRREEPASTHINVSGSMKWNNVSLQVSDLTISSNYGKDLYALDLNRFEWLRSIEIGDDCFGSVETFKIDGLNRLKTIKIGKSSFTKLDAAFLNTAFGEQKMQIANNASKSFHILNCKSLESIQIGQYSFSDFAGGFELKNLPQLQSIQIGTIGKWSCNFWWCSFVIRGIELILNIVMIRSSKSTNHYFRNSCIL